MEVENLFVWWESDVDVEVGEFVLLFFVCVLVKFGELDLLGIEKLGVGNFVCFIDRVCVGIVILRYSDVGLVDLGWEVMDIFYRNVEWERCWLG